jgi:hypothetical protein
MNFNTSTPSFNQSPIILDFTPELGESILEMLDNEVEIYRFFLSGPALSDSFLLSAFIGGLAHLWLVGNFGFLDRADEKFRIGFHQRGRFLFVGGVGVWGWTIV